MSAAGESGRALRVGAVVAVSLILLAVGIWILGSTSRVWSAKDAYGVKFNNVQGLAEGSIVSVSGFTIGTVSSIRLPKSINEGLVEVELRLERKHAHYIREDTKARIKTIGLLGDKYIELSPGSLTARVLEPGSEVTAVQPPNLDALIDAAGPLTGNLAVLTDNLRKITDRWERGEGFLGALISDTEDGRRLSADIRSAIGSIRSMGEKADSGGGLVGTLLNDPRPARELKDSISTLARVSRSLETGPGLAARMLSDPEFGREASDNLNDASRELKDFATKLNQGNGLVPRLATDAEYGAEVAENLRVATSNIASITRRVAEGEGTLGKLLVDETLYRGVNDILAGASKSRLTRWFVSRSQKSGAQDRLRPAPSPSPAAR